jgi:hypothetical protein
MKSRLIYSQHDHRRSALFELHTKISTAAEMKVKVVIRRTYSIIYMDVEICLGFQHSTRFT